MASEIETTSSIASMSPPVRPSLTAGTWAAARLGAEIALTAQRCIRAGERAVFALSRPPGHHAGPDFLGGYCFINNAAVAAQAFVDDGAQRVAILDVDYHHGNGTQAIFYDRADVLFQSIHGDPRTAAGEPLRDDVIACTRKPIDPADYGPVTLSDEDRRRLEAVFPDGVCDWTKPSVGEQPPTGTWRRYTR